MIVTLRDTVFDFASRCHYMGIVNVTPDSFSDGGLHDSAASAIRHALRLVEDGADVIDIGGESTRPGALPVSAEDELDRAIPVIAGIRKSSDVPISIDTRNASTAEEALRSGADMINDVSALRHDPRMAAVAAASDAPVALMHMLGTPETMQAGPSYDDVVSEVLDFLRERIAFARAAGIRNILVDPGIGFGKTVEHNLALLGNLPVFRGLGAPLLVGTSRKSFIGALTDSAASERLPGTIGSCVAAALHGAAMLRVHDVREVRMAVRVAEAIAAAKREIP